MYGNPIWMGTHRRLSLLGAKETMKFVLFITSHAGFGMENETNEQELG
jgi:hypothetical protein